MENGSFIENVNKLAKDIDVIKEAIEIFREENIKELEHLKGIDLVQVVEDLRKGNYLGNRKIDIDLLLNNLSNTEMPTYSQADIILVDGMKLEMPFDNGADGVLELSSHGDIKDYISSHILYINNVVNTEITTMEAFEKTPAMIRIRDADGKSSNIERISLTSYTGTVKNTKPSYFWAKTTSSLQTLANRIGDIIQLGNDIDSIVALSQRINELIVLQEHIDGLNSISDNMEAVLNAKSNANLAQTNAEEANKSADIATEKAKEATSQATTATDKANAILGLTIQVNKISSSQNPSVIYNAIDGIMTINLPQGLKGDIGEAFTVNMTGNIADRNRFDLAAKGFSYLSLDTTPTKIYFKASDDSGNWTKGVAFGKGDKGDTGDDGISILGVARTRGDGSAGTHDTYTITLTNNLEYDFTVYNGANSDISSADLLELQTKLTTALESKANIVGDEKQKFKVSPATTNTEAINKQQLDTAIANTEAINKQQLDTAIANNKAFASGTRLIFQQSSAPTGWTKETDEKYNEATLKFTTGDVSTGGSVAFNDAFKGQAIKIDISGSVGATTLSINQMPSHNHTLNAFNGIHYQSYTTSSAMSSGQNILRRISNTNNTGGSASHTHSLSGASGSATLNLAVKYASTIIATKD